MRMIVEPAIIDGRMAICVSYKPPGCGHKCASF